MNENQIKNILKEKFSEAQKIQLEIEETECGKQMLIIIISIEFEKMGLIQRHQLVHELLEKNSIKYHGVQLKLYTPQESIKIGIK